MDFRGFDSSRILILRGGIPRPIGDSPECLTQAMLVGVMLVGRLSVLCHIVLSLGLVGSGLCKALPTRANVRQVSGLRGFWHLQCSPSLTSGIYIYICMYIERERERERDIPIYIYIYIYREREIHAYIIVSTITMTLPLVLGARGQRPPDM